MRVLLSIAKREFSSFFYSPIGYVVLALFMLMAGLMFLIHVFRAGDEASLRQMFIWLVWVFNVVAPAISMRLISEESKSGTIEALLTAPVTDIQVVLGKWLGALAFFVVMLIPSLFYVVVLELWADPEYGPIFSGYFGLTLVGAMYIAIGTFASSITKNQIIAFLIAAFIILLLTVVTQRLPQYVPAEWGKILYFINVNERNNDFTKGFIDLSNLIYFISGTALFIVMAVKTMESRKWR